MTDVLDDSIENADWIKQTWDLPPYLSPEFFLIVPYEDLDKFRKRPVYKNAVSQGLIHDDQWMADWCEPTDKLRAMIDEAFKGFDGDAPVNKVAIDEMAHEAATSMRNDLPEPTDEQKHAGNYKKGHIVISGVRISIENPKGTRRKPGWTTLKAHYGYVLGVIGNDGDHVDVFVREGTDSEYTGPVYVIDQYIDGKFDEHKCLLGFDSKQAAVKAYLDSYQKGWQCGPVTKLTWQDFKLWLQHGDHTQPLSKSGLV